MSENKVKFTFQNLNNILKTGNQQLIQFENKQYLVKKVTPQNLQNKLFVDQSGELYVRKNGKRDYSISRQKYGLMPNFCPECNRIMGKKQYDSFFWTVHKRCYDCSMKLQRKMQRQGVFQEYAINYMKKKLTSTCDQAISFYQQAKNQYSRSVVINQQGQTQQWSVQDVQDFIKTIDKVIQQIVQYKKTAIQYFDNKLRELKLDATK